MAVSIIIPAYNGAEAVGETVSAARGIDSTVEIIVVDDGSRDGTAQAARDAGADRVIVLPGNQGKGGAMAAGLAAAEEGTVLFLDSDLGESAALAGPLVEAIAGGAAMSVAVFPEQRGGGGFGLARGLAAAVIRLLGGIEATAPLSGQRAAPKAVVAHLGLAPRFGVETALTAEAVHLGLPVAEVPLPLRHHPTGRTIAGFIHRARQFQDILRYAVPAAYGLGWPALSSAATVARVALWLAALAITVTLSVVAGPHAAVIAAVAALSGVVAWLPCLWLSTIWLRLRKPNYLGRSLSAAAGIMFPIVGLPLLWHSGLPHDLRTGAVIVVSVLGAVGLLDDLFASRRQARGLRGHLRAVLSGRLTTGGIKAVGGLAAGAVVGAILSPRHPSIIVLDALLIALSANFINLLDLRPSRALKGFGVLCAVCILSSPGSLGLLGPLLALAVVAAPAEFAGRVMLGDVGANVLGGAAGLGLVIALTPWQKLAALLLLVAFHILCERLSFSQAIEKNRLLLWFDRLGTAHLPPLPTGAAP